MLIKYKSHTVNAQVSKNIIQLDSISISLAYKWRCMQDFGFMVNKPYYIYLHCHTIVQIKNIKKHKKYTHSDNFWSAFCVFHTHFWEKMHSFKICALKNAMIFDN